MRLAILVTHPIQYYAPIFRELAKLIDVHVFYGVQPDQIMQGREGFGVPFAWDIDLLSGYSFEFLVNVSSKPNPSVHKGVDCPGILDRLRAGKFDAVLTIGWHVKYLQQGIIAAKRLGLPVIVRGDSQLTRAGTIGRRIAKECLYPVLLRTFNAALYVGSRNKEFFRQYHYPECRLFHSPHCVDNARFANDSLEPARATKRAAVGIPDQQKVVLFAGKLVSFKQPIAAVEAVAQLRSDGIDGALLVAGTGPLLEEVQARSRELRVPLHYLGFQNQSEMPGVYAAADVLALPSTSRETWGLVSNEALASGLPVVVSDAAGCAPDLAQHYPAARSFAYGNSEQLAAGLSEVILNPPPSQSVRDAASAFSIKAACDGILHALEYTTKASRTEPAGPER